MTHRWLHRWTPPAAVTAALIALVVVASDAPALPVEAATAPAVAMPVVGGDPGKRPNVVLIVADDLGYGDVCAYGCEVGRTPEIDALAASGIRFTSAYVSGPLCTPTRAGLLTGRYQQRFGVEYGAGSIARVEREGLGVPESEVMLPALLGRAGYATGMVGKWHLGSHPQFHPLSRGFDEFFGFLHGGQLYFDASDRPEVVAVSSASAAGADDPPRRIAANPMLRGRTPVEETTYLTEAFTREAVDFIGRHHVEPFFLYLAYNAPHTPLQVTRERYDRFPEIADQRRRVYAAMVSALDDGVGAVRRAIEDAGISETTLVLFLSDNGCPTYVDACSNGPLLGGKLTHFEGGVHVPFLASWPGTIPPGRTSDVAISSLDVFPTLLELASGAPAPDRPIDGTSLVKLLRSGGADRRAVPDRAFYWRNRENFAIRYGQWKLVSLNQKHTYLFDLSAGPEERRDLAAAKRGKVRDLLERYRRWEAGMRAPLWTPVSETVLEYLLPWTGKKESFVVTV